MGVPPDDTERMFEEPRRGEVGSATPGTGLRLARSQVVTDDGSGGVEDAPGGGARFVVRLPHGAPA
jgi:two-component system OmpR family sensor kinase